MSLDAQLTDHRAMYRDELDFTPSQRTPPVAYTFDKDRRMMVPDDRPLVINPLKPNQIEIPDSATQSTQVGMPMSGRMLRYLQGPAADTPWSKALFALRFHCRRDHAHHRSADRPYWRGALCHQAVKLVIIGGEAAGIGPMTPEQASQVLRIDHLEELLIGEEKDDGTRTPGAFGWIEKHIDDARDKAEVRLRDDEGRGPGAVPAPEWRHHAPSDEHRAECPNIECTRRRAA